MTKRSRTGDRSVRWLVEKLLAPAYEGLRFARAVKRAVVRVTLRLARILKSRLGLAAVRGVVLCVMFLIALIGRFKRKRVDIGLGPEPMINNVYHKRALERFGYTAETFVNTVYFITDEFDIRADRVLDGRLRLATALLQKYAYFLRAIYVAWLQFTRYRCLYTYFQGGQLGHFHGLVAKAEPSLLRLARVKTVLMPYGGDVHELSRCPNLLFKHAMAVDYPGHRMRRQDIALRIDRWTQKSDHVISGCDWVDYMFHWDTLMLGHFSIDTDQWEPSPDRLVNGQGPVRVLHAPNHRTIKGTEFFVRAIQELREEGVDVELVLVERVPNSEIKRLMSTIDIVADQLVVGWYAMFALEAMATGLPVLCYIREDLERLYVSAGLLEANELPIVRCTPETVKDVLRDLVADRARRREIGDASRAFVERRHSLDAIGAVFDRINRAIGVCPSREAGGAS